MLVPMVIALNAESRGIGGTPVLFVHSFAGDLTHWTAQLEHLKSRRRAVAFDLSGHGHSPAPAGRYSIRELAKDVAAVANSQGLEHFVLIGHSTGALIAAEYAGANPQRVKALGLIDAPPAPGAVPRKILQQLRAALAKDPFATIEKYWEEGPFVNSRPETRAKLLSSLRRLTRNAAIDLTESGFDCDATIPLRSYSGPKFAIVTPNNDAPLSLHNAVPDFQHTVVEGTGHWIHLDEPAEFNQVLDKFIEQ